MKGVALEDNTLFFTTGCNAYYLDPIPLGIVATGASQIGSGTCSTTVTPTASTVAMPSGITAYNGTVFVASEGQARVLRFQDTTAPTIPTGPSVSVSGSTATFTWTTSESATTEVHYGLVSAGSKTDPGLYANHSEDLTITGTSKSRAIASIPVGMYYYRVQSKDGAGNVVFSTEGTFGIGAPTITDMQAGDDTWRNAWASTTKYDVRFSDSVGLQRFETRVCATAAGCVTPLQDWTQVATLSGTSATVTWAILSSTFTAMAEGTNHVSVRVFNTNGVSTELTDAFYVKKDTATAPPTAMIDGDGATDIDYVNTTSAMSASWTASTEALSGVARYDVCISTLVDCTGTKVLDWTDVGNVTAVTRTGIVGMLQFSTYRVAVRTVDLAGNMAVASTNGQRIDRTNPNAPTLVSPNDAAVVSAIPTFTATYSDQPTASPGQVEFQVCRDASCTDVATSGTSTSTLIASGSNGSWTPATLAAGSYWWRALNRDAAGNASGWSATTRTFVLNYAPDPPIQQSPTSGGWVNSTQPVLSARFRDLDPGASGSVQFELCSSNAAPPWTSANCGTAWSSGSSPTGLVHDALGTWMPTSTLVHGSTYWWRVNGTDQHGLVSSYSASRSFSVDTSIPSEPTNVQTTSRGNGSMTFSWTASSDTGSGVAGYEVEAWSTVGGVTTQQTCVVTGTTCKIGGLGNSPKLIVLQVRACDAAGNCSDWASYSDGSGEGYYLRTDPLPGTPSTVLTATSNRKAPTAAAADDLTNTSVTISNTADRWYQFGPATDNTLAVVGDSTTPTGTGGWVVDDYANRVADGGPVSVTFETAGGGPQGTGYMQCRVWKVGTVESPSGSGNWVLSPGSTQHLGSQELTASDALEAGANTQTCEVGGLAAQTSFGPKEALYVELWLHVTSGSNGRTVTLTGDDDSFITAPPAGAAPNAPLAASMSPADMTLVSRTPMLSATYVHPMSTFGLLEFEVATDSLFTNVVDGGVSPTGASGSTASYTTQALNPTTSYYWRVRARDEGGRTSAWTTATMRVVTTTKPNTPTNATPAHLGTVTSSTPNLTASAFSDPNGASDSHTASRWQLRPQTGSYASPTADSGTVTTSLTSWSTSTPLTNGGTYYWRVQYRDAFGEWSSWSNETAFVVNTTSAPANTVKPVVSGSAEQGSALTVNTGTWTGSPTSHAYQWQACDTPTWRAQSTLAGSTPSTSITISRPTGTVAGDVMFAHLGIEDDLTEGAPTGVPSGWTLVSGITGPAIGNPISYVYRKTATSSEPSTYTWTIPTAQPHSAAIVSYSGVDPASPVHASAGTSAPDGTSFTTPTITTTVSNTRVLSFFTIDLVNSVTDNWVSAGATERYDFYDTNNWDMVAMYEELKAAPGTASRTATVTNGRAAVAQIVALAPTCSDVGTGASYTPTAADVGRTLRVRVTATNASGSGSVITLSSIPVTALELPTFSYLTGFEHGVLSTAGGGVVSTLTGTPTIETEVVRNGAYALRIAKANNVTQHVQVASGTADAVTRMAVRFEDVPTTDAVVWTGVASSGSSAIVRFDVASGRLLAAIGGATQLSNVTVVADTWYVLDISFSVGGDPRTLTWAVNGATQNPVSLVQVAAPTVTHVRFGSSALANVYTAYIDDVAISTTSGDFPIGDGKVVALRPDGRVANASDTNIGDGLGDAFGAASHFQVDDSPLASDAQYLRQNTNTTGTAFAELSMRNTGGGAAPRGVRGLVAHRSETGGAATAGARFRSGTTETSIHQAAMPTSVEFSAAMVDAPGGDGWSAAELDALTARVGYATAIADRPVWDAVLAEAEFAVDGSTQHHLAMRVEGWDADGTGPNVAPAAIDLGSVLPGSTVTAEAEATVTTGAAGGYTLSASDPDGNGGLHNSAAASSLAWNPSVALLSAATLSNWSGTGIGVSAYGGLSTPSKFCDTTCASKSSTALNWGRLSDTGTSYQLTSRAAPTLAGDTTRIPLRVAVPTTQSAGSYVGEVHLTATAVP